MIAPHPHTFSAILDPQLSSLDLLPSIALDLQFQFTHFPRSLLAALRRHETLRTRHLVKVTAP
jgi:hypothetical protein